MAIRLKTSPKVIKEYLNNGAEKIIQGVLQMLVHVGNECITEARSNGSYMDRTGNLRSSIGYVVMRDGVVVLSNVNSLQSMRYMEELRPKYNKGTALIVVAGMNYAAHVEARGYNVLVSAELEAEKLTKLLLTKLGFIYK